MEAEYHQNFMGSLMTVLTIELVIQYE